MLRSSDVQGVQSSQNPEILIPQLVWQKLFCYIRSVLTEISGFGTCQVKKGTFHVQDIFVIKQNKPTPSRASISAEDMGQVVANFVADGGNARELCLQWHSHSTMPVYWSSTDEDNIKNLLSMAPLLVSFVTDCAGNCLCRVDCRIPFRFRLDLKPVVVLSPVADEQSTQWRQEAHACVGPADCLHGDQVDCVLAHYPQPVHERYKENRYGIKC